MSSDTQAQRVSKDTVRIGKGQFAILRYLHREGEVEYREMIRYLIADGAYTSKQWAEEHVGLLIAGKVIDRKGNGSLRLTALGKKLLDILELLLQAQRKKSGL